MKWRACTILALLGIPLAALAEIKTQTVAYSHDGTALEGFLAYDDAITAKRPAVLIVHDWNSIDDYERGRARQLAEMGYVAFAVDIYGKDIRPKNPGESGAQAGKYKGNRELLRARALAGLETLRKDPRVDTTRVAAIGYCFGGTTVLELARAGVDLKGVVSFHGGLDAAPGMTAGDVKAKILVLHGADDPAVPPAQVSGFMEEMRKAKADWQFIAYSGAVHSFTEPKAGNDNSRGAAYNAAADRRSWEHMRTFFQEIF